MIDDFLHAARFKVAGERHTYTHRHCQWLSSRLSSWPRSNRSSAGFPPSSARWRDRICSAPPGILRRHTGPPCRRSAQRNAVAAKLPARLHRPSVAERVVHSFKVVQIAHHHHRAILSRDATVTLPAPAIPRSLPGSTAGQSIMRRLKPHAFPRFHQSIFQFQYSLARAQPRFQFV